MKKRIAFIVMLLTMASSQIASADSGVVNTASLRVREKPSLTSSITGFLSKNANISTLGKEGDFYKISFSGETGYVHTSYVNIEESTPTTKIVASIKPYYIEKYGVITASSLNVRAGAGPTYPVTGAIKLGSKVTMLEDTNGFYKIIYSGKTSYISSLYVKVTGQKGTSSPTAPAPAPTPVPTPALKSTGVGTITASDFLSVRKSASLANNVIVMGKKYPKEKVDIYGSEGEFYKIKYAGEWGYIYKSYVSVVATTSDKAEYVENGKQYDTKTTGNNLVSYSNTFLGTPYLWGGATPAKFNTTGQYLSGGFDCSGFVQYSYKNFGINLPRTTMDQIDIGASVNINNLENGDLVFFTTNSAAPSEVSHVGIYIGNNKFMHSPKPGDVIKISELTGYYADNFVIGKRIIQ
ncbi:SH3 domain-containing protein [Clostridium estertheticum]|uniref:C40 family peptidase n=1 Tax=Clostridium estertheticum TaxID=238834 RepID=UPI0013E930F8|nr:SH3 domain-containing protein [Clostridium estertheticum]MBZ9689148.1 SH3 domain-containing protein [Clostridium estertheticum]